MLIKGEDEYQFFCRYLIQEMKTHRESYTNIYTETNQITVILNALVSYLTGPTPFEKWTHFLYMGQLIVNAYDKVCIDLT